MKKSTYTCEEVKKNVVRGFGACHLCNCRGYKGWTGDYCKQCGHSPRDHG